MGKENRFISFLLGLAAVAAVAALLCGIFILSEQSGAQSQDLSDELVDTLYGKIVSLLPPLTLYGIHNDVRKYAHVFEYMALGVLSFFMFRIFTRKRHRSPLYPLIPSAIFCLLCAAADEYHQTFVPGRAGRLSDVFLDAKGFLPGIGAAFILCFIVFNIKRITYKRKNEK